MSSNEKNVVKVRGSVFMHIMNALFLFGGLFSCYYLIKSGLKFESPYSFRYIYGGISLGPFFLYESLWILPRFLPPGRVLFTIYKGQDGRIVQKKKSLLIKNIKHIDHRRSRINLFNQIYVETFDQKKVKIKTDNLLFDVDFFEIVDEHIYPYMTDETKLYWNEKVARNELLKSINYQRKSQI